MSTDDLIRRLVEPPGGSRELDAEIAVAIFDEQNPNPGEDLIYAKLPHKDHHVAAGTYWRHSRSGMSLRTAPHYTTSIDAALTLVPEGWTWSMAGGGDRGTFHLLAPPPEDDRFDRKVYSRVAAKPALALSAAALEAWKEM